MENHTYVNDLGFNNSKVITKDHKLAKISEEKLANIRLKTFEVRKTFRLTAGTIPKAAPAQAPAVAPAPVAPTQEAVVKKPNNFTNVTQMFGMKIYKSSNVKLPLSAARKIRTGSKILKPLIEFAAQQGDGFLDVTPAKIETAESQIIEATAVNMAPVTEQVQAPKPATAPVIEKPIQAPIAPAPSVDDYLQKEQKEVHVDNPIAVLITQLEGDINTLKNEAVLKTEELKKLEEEYKNIQAEKQARIEKLREEKLGYTTTLKGLNDEIIKMREAIAKEKNNLNQGQKAA